MTYDPDLRRDTPLALKLKEQIKREGPIDVGQFISACLWDETDGYYATKAILGRAGDFITAPEISQVFGELLGLWAAVVWQQMGSPDPINLVEFGPGRGTLMADALRAMGRVPGLEDALNVVLMEASNPLRELQKTALAKSRARLGWTEGFPLDGGRPTILLANEFLDVFAPDQSVKTGEGWRWRAVGLDAEGRFQFTISHGTRLRGELGKMWPTAASGSIFEDIASDELAVALTRMAKSQHLAALFIDYGHMAPVLGETLQAVRGHAFEHSLTSPGEADLSIQVDFAAVAQAMTRAGLTVDGPITQAEFLGRLGIIERASKLMSANPAHAGEIEAGVARLMTPNGMGTRFKAIGIRSPGVPKLPGF